MEKIRNFFKDESGASAVEYGLLCSLIACAIIIAVTQFGTNLASIFDNTKTRLGTGAAPS